MEEFEQKKIEVAYSEHKLDIAESKITPAGKSGQLLGKTSYLNFLARDVLLKSDLDKGCLEECALGLTSFAKDLSRSLSQQLENVTEIIQDTCHLLSALHDKHKELTGSPGKYGKTYLYADTLGILDAEFCSSF